MLNVYTSGSVTSGRVPWSHGIKAFAQTPEYQREESGLRESSNPKLIEQKVRRTGRVGGSLLPICRNGTCLVYCQGGNWHIRKGGLAEGGRSQAPPNHVGRSPSQSHLYFHNLHPSAPLHVHIECQAAKDLVNSSPSTSQRRGRRPPDEQVGDEIQLPYTGRRGRTLN